MNKLMYSNVIKRLSVILLIIFASANVSAQFGPNLAGKSDKKKFLYSHYNVVHEFSVWGAASYTSYVMTKANGSIDMQLQPLMGFDYTFWLSNNIGISTGAEYATYKTKLEVTNFNDQYPIIGGDYIFSTTINKLEEKIESKYVNIPIKLNYQTGKGIKLYAALGGKVGIPLSGQSKIDYVSAISHATTGGVSMPNMGLYVSRGLDKQDVDFKLSFMATADLGVKWMLTGNSAIYTGFYADYGINNILDRKNNSNTRLVEYKPGEPSSVVVHSALTSEYRVSNNAESYFIKKLAPMSVGFKVRFSLGIGVSKKTRNVPLREYLYEKYQDDSYSTGKYQSEDDDNSDYDDDNDDGYYY